MKNCSGINCPMQYGVVDAATCPAAECCPNATPPLTNYDRIIYKSPEELAKLFTHLCCPYSLGGKVECNIENKGCKACWLDWLKQEADHA